MKSVLSAFAMPYQITSNMALNVTTLKNRVPLITFRAFGTHAMNIPIGKPLLFLYTVDRKYTPSHI